jgi:hypothetical protein
MSEVQVLRDHSQRCEHPLRSRNEVGAYLSESIGPVMWKCQREGCPGGREVRLRREWVCQVGQPWCTSEHPHPEVGAPHHRCGWFMEEVPDGSE